jgi:hypothetical protein
MVAQNYKFLSLRRLVRVALAWFSELLSIFPQDSNIFVFTIGKTVYSRRQFFVTGSVCHIFL